MVFAYLRSAAVHGAAAAGYPKHVHSSVFEKYSQLAHSKPAGRRYRDGRVRTLFAQATPKTCRRTDDGNRFARGDQTVAANTTTTTCKPDITTFVTKLTVTVPSSSRCSVSNARICVRVCVCARAMWWWWWWVRARVRVCTRRRRRRMAYVERAACAPAPL